MDEFVVPSVVPRCGCRSQKHPVSPLLLLGERESPPLRSVEVRDPSRAEF